MIKSPNYTQVPNDFLGTYNQPGIMSSMTGGEVKVYLAICRLTFGFHRERVRISVRKIAKMTGMSPTSINEATKKLVEKSLITNTQDGGVTIWQAVVLPESPEDEDTSVPLTETPVSETDTAVPETDTPSIKEIVKETIIGLDKSVLSFPADTRQIIIKINELWHISPPEPFTPQWKFWVKSVKELLAACGESDPLIVIDRVYDRWLNGKFTVASPRSLVNTAKFIANNMGLAYWGNDTKKKVDHWG